MIQELNNTRHQARLSHQAAQRTSPRAPREQPSSTTTTHKRACASHQRERQAAAARSESQSFSRESQLSCTATRWRSPTGGDFAVRARASFCIRILARLTNAIWKYNKSQKLASASVIFEIQLRLKRRSKTTARQLLSRRPGQKRFLLTGVTVIIDRAIFRTTILGSQEPISLV